MKWTSIYVIIIIIYTMYDVSCLKDVSNDNIRELQKHFYFKFKPQNNLP